MSGELGNLLLVLATNEDDASCALSSFLKDVTERATKCSSLTQAITSMSLALGSEEEEVKQVIERCKVARDKLLAETHRIDAQLVQAEKKYSSITAAKKYCRMAVNAIASGVVKAELTKHEKTKGTSVAVVGQPVSHSVELPDHLSAPTMSFPQEQTRQATLGSVGYSADDFDVDGIVAILSMSDVREGPLQQALSNLEAQLTPLTNYAVSSDEAEKLERLVDAVIANVPHPRPPSQVLELRIVSHIAKRCFAHSNTRVSNVIRCLESETVVSTVVRLLHSVNDDVKSEALECLFQLVQRDHVKKTFADVHGIEPLVSIVASSTNETVLERALVFLWSLISNDPGSLKTDVRQQGGLRAALDLLYTDSMPILENVAICIGYLTREEESKVAIRDAGGLEKLTATLRHPAESIQTKIAGAIWNCASNNENRVLLRQLGCIPALIELLHVPHEHVQENAAGALWNLSVDSENKTQILDYGGIAILIKLLQSSKSSNIVENVTGTLWNCSAVLENRAAIRKFGGIAPLVGFLRSGSEKIQDNCAGALRNCAINDQNKTAILEAGGVELVFELLHRLPATTQDKLVAMLWILTAAPEVKHAVRLCGGLPLLVDALAHAPLATQEKIVGALRNCATEATNRSLMNETKVIAALVKFVAENREKVSPTAKEAVASATWFLCRDDKTTARKERGLHLMCELLHDDCVGVVEHAAGAISSLTITEPENRDIVREEGGFVKLLELLVVHHEVAVVPLVAQQASQAVSFSPALLNVLLSIRNTTSANETNMKLAASFPQLARVLVFIVSRGVDEHAKEAALCIKNLSLDKHCVEEMLTLGVVPGLTSLAERGVSDGSKKAAAMALQSVTRYGGISRR